MDTIQAKVSPGQFLSTFAKKLDEHGESLLEGLFQIATGHVNIKRDQSGQIVSVDVKDRLSAIRLISELGGFKEVMKALLKIAQKGRPVDGSDSEVPAFARRYAEMEEKEKD